jgi:hypothetical protein
MRKNTHIERMVKSIEKELLDILKNNSISEIKYPINFENDLGIFQLRDNNSLLIQPRKGVEYLVLNINILPTNGNF